MRSKGLNVKVPRLGLNRHGVYYVRSSAPDATGSRKVTQRSLGTKDPLLAKALALRFCLSLISEELMTDWRKNLPLYEINLEKGILKADGPEDHAAMMEAMRFLDPEAFFRLASERNQQAAQAQPALGVDEYLRAAFAIRDGQMLPNAHLPIAAGKTLRVALDEHLEEESTRLKSPRTAKEKRALFDEFAAFFGDDKHINQITTFDISEHWRKAEAKRPSQKVSKVKRDELAAIAKASEKPVSPITLSLPRLEKRRGYLSVFFQWAIDGGAYMHKNPMGQKVAKKKDMRRLSSSYREYTGNDLKALFGPSYAAEMTKPDWYWVPMMALWSGARLNEMASLTTDVFEVVDDVKVFHITDSKTEGGRRTVPIHSNLLSLGLWEYVEALRSEGEKQLFWFRPRATVSKSTGENWAKRIERCGITDTDKVFHSFRSTAITNMHNSPGPNPAAIRSAVGHAGGLTGSHGDYVRGSELLLVQAAIESLSYPTVDIQHLMLEDPTFSEFYRTQKERLASPDHLAQRERRIKHAAVRAEREARVARQTKKKLQ